MAASRYTPTGEQHLGQWLSEYHWDPLRFVYVIQGDPETPIKVGIANDVHKRMKGIQTGYPWRLRLLFAIPGDQHLEWYLHQRLKGHRLLGEWFQPDPDFLDFVADLADRMFEAWDGSEDVPYYGDFHGIGEALPASKQRHAVSVRYVDPDPMSDEDAEQLRRLTVKYGEREGFRRFERGWRIP